MERRALQLAICVACLLPLIIGGMGVLHGPAAFGHPTDVPRDLDSQFRYVSGIFLGAGIAFLSCIPHVERKGARFRLLGALIVAGGLARGVSWLDAGAPSLGHRLGLVMELAGVPLLMLWQARIAARAVSPPASADRAPPPSSPSRP